MIQPFHIRIAAAAVALGLLAACTGKVGIDQANSDSAAAQRIAAAAEATAAAAAEKAGKATQLAEQAKQVANAAASRAESAAKPAAPSTPVSTPAQPVSTPAQPAEPVTPPAEPVAPAEPVTPPAEPVTPPAEPVVTPVEPATPAGDAVAGQAKARRCLACHTFNQSGSHKTGPNLFGVTTRPAGTAAGFNYSAGLGNAGFSWDAASLAAWVCDSKEAIKQLTGNDGARTSMANQRICGADAANVAAYLETLK